ncbi:hypothetical protein K488DRAFT_68883 [Vararia minispora EC-137]|uniref:Uncharacterized protein n=1 Tax=Vararia minispora EC-137 TaxID=1314806 RepID=A0ACB8QSK8_9AGAM|nr:hypothetical protein K488DRAFT_68883 [Vararia minispora EC-137]
MSDSDAGTLSDESSTSISAVHKSAYACTECIIMTRRQFMQRLNRLYEYADAHFTEESPQYAPTNFLFSGLCNTFSINHAALCMFPQASFRLHSKNSETRDLKRIPDFAAILTHGRGNSAQDKVKFLVEDKIRDIPSAKLRLEEKSASEFVNRASLKRHVKQMTMQALCVLSYFPACDHFFVYLIQGSRFSLLCFRRPPDWKDIFYEAYTGATKALEDAEVRQNKKRKLGEDFAVPSVHVRDGTAVSFPSIIKPDPIFCHRPIRNVNLTGFSEEWLYSVALISDKNFLGKDIKVQPSFFTPHPVDLSMCSRGRNLRLLKAVIRELQDESMFDVQELFEFLDTSHPKPPSPSTDNDPKDPNYVYTGRKLGLKALGLAKQTRAASRPASQATSPLASPQASPVALPAISPAPSRSPSRPISRASYSSGFPPLSSSPTSDFDFSEGDGSGGYRETQDRHSAGRRYQYSTDRHVQPSAHEHDRSYKEPHDIGAGPVHRDFDQLEGSEWDEGSDEEIEEEGGEEKDDEDGDDEDRDDEDGDDEDRDDEDGDDEDGDDEDGDDEDGDDEDGDDEDGDDEDGDDEDGDDEDGDDEDGDDDSEDGDVDDFFYLRPRHG